MDTLNWPIPILDELYIHEEVQDSDVSLRVRSLYPKLTPQFVRQRPYQDREGSLSGEEFSHSKRRLYLSRHEGHFFRKCPGTHGAACCNYFVLNLGVQCNMNCSYCYLQSYINSPVSQIYTNIDDALQELDEISLKYPNSPFRVGTGETIDSLAHDDLTLYSTKIVDWFAKHPKLTCEFKTKSSNVKNFVHRPHGGNVVVSFSVNPDEIVKKEEHGTAPLENRLRAAKLAEENGFPIAFHIDPMIAVENWESLYSGLVDNIAQIFSPQNLKWISVGALRYPPAMKNILRERLPPSSEALTGELFLSSDGKLRYDQGLRTKMFNHVISGFHRHSKKYPVFLCMEAPESWIGSFDTTPRNVEGISYLFKPLAGPQ